MLLSNRDLQTIKEYLESVEHGHITIVVHAARIVKFEVTRSVRLEGAEDRLSTPAPAKNSVSS